MNKLLPFKSGLLATILFFSHSGYATDVLENTPVEGSLFEEAEGSVINDVVGVVQESVNNLTVISIGRLFLNVTVIVARRYFIH